VKAVIFLLAVGCDQSVLAADKVKAMSGTGFFITNDGYLLTNHHVVKGASHISIKIEKGWLSAKVVKVDNQNDLAVLKVDGKFAALPVVSSRKVGLGDEVFTVGFPQIDVQGVSAKYTKGNISSLTGIKDDPRRFQISVPIQPGNSGGPLVDEYGNVVGVVVQRLNALKLLKETGRIPQNVNYAVKSSFANSFLQSLPKVVNKLKDPNPHTKPRTRSDVIKEVQAATRLILVRHNSSLVVEKAIRKMIGKPTGKLTRADLEKVTELSLPNNILTDVPKDLEKLTQLQKLDLSANQLTNVKGLENLTKLQVLVLHSNKLTDLKGLEKLAQLTRLILNNNKLTDLKSLQNLSQLEGLGLGQNQLTDVKGLERLTQLKELYLGINELTDVKDLEKLTKLEKLYLNNNQLTDVKGLENLTQLTNLSLGGNQLTDVKGLENLTQLTSLGLFGNKLTDVKGLEKLTRLAKLYLQNNMLSKAQIDELQKALPKCKITHNAMK
jgi:Leucine-rich repeat (LRR) protein